MIKWSIMLKLLRKWILPFPLAKEVIRMNVTTLFRKKTPLPRIQRTQAKLATKASQRKASRLYTAVFLCLSGITAMASAQVRVIDNFTSGPFRSLSYRTGINKTAYAAPSSQNGTMIGGNRSTSMFVCTPGACGLAQPVSYEFKHISNTKGAFLFNAGFGAGPRIDMAYGFGSLPMNEDFTPYDRIRVTFLGLSQPLNFNIQTFTGTTWAQNGCNVTELNRPFSIDFPFSGFTVSIPASFNWATINFMSFIFQSGSVIGSVDLGISSIVLTNSPPAPTEPAVLQTCSLI